MDWRDENDSLFRVNWLKNPPIHLEAINVYGTNMSLLIPIPGSSDIRRHYEFQMYKEMDEQRDAVSCERGHSNLDTVHHSVAKNQQKPRCKTRHYLKYKQLATTIKDKMEKLSFLVSNAPTNATKTMHDEWRSGIFALLKARNACTESEEELFNECFDKILHALGDRGPTLNNETLASLVAVHFKAYTSAIGLCRKNCDSEELGKKSRNVLCLESAADHTTTEKCIGSCCCNEILTGLRIR